MEIILKKMLKICRQQAHNTHTIFLITYHFLDSEIGTY